MLDLITNRLKTTLIRRKKPLLIGMGILLLFYLLIPLPSSLFKPDYSTVVLDERSQILRVFLNRNEQWSLPPQEDLEIPQKLKTAVLAYEDRYFYYHPGINPAALARALRQNLSSRRTVSGASTLTMQVARLIAPKQRTYLNKLLEIFQALKIETQYSKEEILRLYLNHAPYGGNIVGYQAASLRYFRKLPEALTWGEAAALAVLPNAPGLISPDVNREALKSKRDRLLRRLQAQGSIDAETCRLALLEPLPEGSFPFEMLAPHLGQYLKDQLAAQQRGGSGGIIFTTLNADYQRAIEEIVRRQAGYLQKEGIMNAAVLVAETGSGKVRAYIGSQNFFDAAARGQVDGVRAPRSPGSLLKPLLYALCMDEGILLPQTLLNDVPTFYGAFSPNNADEKYDGIVTAKDALVRSLNVPAVRLLYTYGVSPFYLFLKSAGVSTLFRTADDYGLPLILGGAEVRVWDMARLFRGLANGGRFEPLEVLEGSGAQGAKGIAQSAVRMEQSAERKTPPPVRYALRSIHLAPPSTHHAAPAAPLASPMACYLTLNMLRELKRPGAEYYWEQYQNQWPLAWKTGTSYGQRDAWAVGVNPQWTIAVWVGNFSGEGNASLAGARCAGPLLFEIFNYLPKDPNHSWFAKPEEDVATLEICLETGFLAGSDCPNRVFVEAPRYMKPLRLCPYHQRIFVSEDEKYQVCSLCWEPGHYHGRERLVYPPEVAQYLRERGQIVGDLPPHKPDCPGQVSQGAGGQLALQIVYPQEDARLWVPRDFGGELQKVILRAAHRENQRMIYWYLDDRYLGSTVNRHEKAVELARGWHVLEVVDETGFRDRKRFYADMGR